METVEKGGERGTKGKERASYNFIILFHRIFPSFDSLLIEEGFRNPWEGSWEFWKLEEVVFRDGFSLSRSLFRGDSRTERRKGRGMISRRTIKLCSQGGDALIERTIRVALKKNLAPFIFNEKAKILPFFYLFKRERTIIFKERDFYFLSLWIIPRWERSLRIPLLSPLSRFSILFSSSWARDGRSKKRLNTIRRAKNTGESRGLGDVNASIYKLYKRATQDFARGLRTLSNALSWNRKWKDEHVC